MPSFSPRHRFSDWPNGDIPAVAAGVYAIWEAEALIYCGMSGRELEKAADRRLAVKRAPNTEAPGRLTPCKLPSSFFANRMPRKQLQQRHVSKYHLPHAGGA